MPPSFPPHLPTPEQSSPRDPRIAILGDSFSAGEGVGTYFEDTDTDDNACHRSPHTYLAEAFGLPPPYVIACSGAVAADVFSPQPRRNVDAQVDRLIELRDEHGVEAVVLTLGGNDVGFRQIVTACLVVLDFEGCAERIASTPFGRGEPSEAFLSRRFEPLPTALESAYREIDRVVNGRAGRARVPIVVLAYPLPTPRESGPCSAMADRLTRPELEFLERLLSRLNRAVDGAVTRSRQAGVPAFFVAETAAAFQPDHTLCDAQPYARTLGSFAWDRILRNRADLSLPFPGRFSRGIQEFAHPNRSGYAAVSERILRWSRGPEASEVQRLLEGTNR